MCIKIKILFFLFIGLKVIINIGQEDYTDTLGESAGARVVVHPQYHMPFPEDEGFLAKPGQLTSIGLTKVFSCCQDYMYSTVVL